MRKKRYLFMSFLFLPLLHNSQPVSHNTLNINMPEYESWFESYKSLIYNTHFWKFHRTIQWHTNYSQYDNNAICWKIITKKKNLPNFPHIFPWIRALSLCRFGFDSLKTFSSNCCVHSNPGFSKTSISSKHEIINRSYSDRQIPRQNIQWKFQAHLQLDYIFIFSSSFRFISPLFSCLCRKRARSENENESVGCLWNNCTYIVL